MAKRTRRKRRSAEQQIADLEARIEELREHVDAEQSFSPDKVYEERQRLELSAADYAQLVGVSPLTIYNWEHGRSKPRAAQLSRWLDVHGIGKREAWRRLGY